MLRIATWNPQQSSTARKREFVTNVIKADLLVLTECNTKMWGEALDAKRLKILSKDRVLIACKEGEISETDYGKQGPSTYLSFQWHIPNRVSINCLGLYAAGQSGYGLVELETTLRFMEQWLSNERTLLLGDLNTSVELKNKGQAKRSRNIINILEGFGLQSAYHKCNEEDYGNENQKTYVGPSTTKKLEPQIDLECNLQTVKTHIDYIFGSKDLEFISCVIEHDNTNKNRYRDHSAVIAELGQV